MPDTADLHARAIGVRVSKALSCGDDHIVLLDYQEASQSKVWANLRRVRSTGDIVWAGIYAQLQRHFTDVDWRDGRLVAWTWECFMIIVDQETGRAVGVTFTSSPHPGFSGVGGRPASWSTRPPTKHWPL